MHCSAFSSFKPSEWNARFLTNVKTLFFIVEIQCNLFSPLYALTICLTSLQRQPPNNDIISRLPKGVALEKLTVYNLSLTRLVYFRINRDIPGNLTPWSCRSVVWRRDNRTNMTELNLIQLQFDAHWSYITKNKQTHLFAQILKRIRTSYCR